MEDREIVDLFWSRSEDAISQTDRKYGRYCRYIAYKILHDNSDTEEVINDTYLKTWNTIPENRPDSLKSYVGMICRQLSFNVFEAKNRKKRVVQISLVLDELSECIPDNASNNAVGESFELQDALNRFVRSLPENHRQIFVRRYWYSSPVKDIAKAFDMTENHTNVLLFNIRKKLKAFLTEEGFDV